MRNVPTHPTDASPPAPVTVRRILIDWSFADDQPLSINELIRQAQRAGRP